ncbi:Tol-Pal system protein TolB [Gammaproteobacteria bacterium]|nr:Tol-Pal system protein TolB [Gammaproteobacteria bacterium]
MHAMPKHLLPRFVAFCCLTMLALPLPAQLRIEIVGGVARPVPIAVVPFGWQGAGTAPFDVAGLVARDLASSGRFEPLAGRDLVQRPTTEAEVDLGDWKAVGAEAVVIGQLRETAAGQYDIEFLVFDVLRGQRLLRYRQPATAAELRLAAHRVADVVYEKLTGVPGIFSTRIAYVAALHKGGKPDIYRLIIADADGANEQVMVESREPIMSPAWSPDGRKLAYVSFENKVAEIYVQTVRSGARQKVSARSGVNGSPAWSPDGRMLALTLSRGEGNLDLFTLDLGSQVLTRLTDQRSIETEPAWSIDGRSIYFTSDRAGGPQIYRILATGGGAQRVSFEGNYNARPRVSPDGKRLAVVTNDRGNYRIAILDLERGFSQVLTDGRQDESPSFAPNGETLIYATREGGRGVLATVSADGRVRQRIPAAEGDVREPAWSPFRTN